MEDVYFKEGEYVTSTEFYDRENSSTGISQLFVTGNILMRISYYSKLNDLGNPNRCMLCMVSISLNEMTSRET